MVGILVEIKKILTNYIEMEKEQVLRKVYHNEDGFGSIYETYKDAKNNWIA